MEYIGSNIVECAWSRYLNYFVMKIVIAANESLKALPITRPTIGFIQKLPSI